MTKKELKLKENLKFNIIFAEISFSIIMLLEVEKPRNKILI